MNKKAALTLGSALLFVLCIDAFLMMGQSSIDAISLEMGEGVNTTFYNYPGSLISQYDTGGMVISSNGTVDNLIGTDSSISPATGDVFTDTFAKVKSWIISTIPGLAILLKVLSGPYGFLVAIHAPIFISYGVGAIWFGLTFFLLIAFIAGRQE